MVQEGCRVAVVVRAGVHSLATNDDVGDSAFSTTQDAQAPPAAPGPEYATKTPEELQQLVAPIALYPDSLVAQVLSAATFPEQVVEADR